MLIWVVDDNVWSTKSGRFKANIYDLTGLSGFNWEVREYDENGNFIHIVEDGAEDELAAAQHAAEDAIARADGRAT